MVTVQTRRSGVALLARWLGLLAGVVVVSLLVGDDWPGRRVLFAGPVVGIALLAGVLAGELAAPGPDRGPARRALLETRRVTDYLPRSARWVAYLVVAYAVITAGAGVIGGLDPRTWAVCGGPGRYVGVWPKAVYTAPGVVAVAVGVAVAAVVLHRVVSRPRPGGVDPAEDDRARRDTAAAVVAGCAVLIAVPLAGTALLAGLLLSSSCNPGMADIGWVFLGLAAAATAVTLWALGTLLLPQP